MFIYYFLKYCKEEKSLRYQIPQSQQHLFARNSNIPNLHFH